MSPVFYHILHLIGFMLLFLGFGASIHGNEKRIAMQLHGIGLVIMLVAGFGLLAKLGLGYTSGWIIAKIVIWLILGGLPVLRSKGILSPRAVMMVAVVLGGLAASMGYLKQLPW
jgi:formate hydrogenlyase subunit 3/multisubunit Na+/H+ antiporter MnhD subunit